MIKPIFDITGVDGNVFAVIGAVVRTLKKAKLYNEAKEFQAKAITSKSYDEVLALISDYCEIGGGEDD